MKTLTKQENINSIKSEIARYTRLKEMDKDGRKYDDVIKDLKLRLIFMMGV